MVPPPGPPPITTSFGFALACPSTAGANNGVASVPSEAPASSVKCRRVRSVMASSPLWSFGSGEIGRERLDLVVLQSSRDVLHHVIGEPLVAIGLDHFREGRLGHTENAWDRAGRGGAAMTGHAFAREMAAKLDVSGGQRR